jgi:hypothetical protein
MMLSTVAREPASWVAILPQKFSVATTWMVPDATDVGLPQAVASDMMAPRAARAVRVDLT